MKTKLLNINSIKVDKELYPRIHTDFVTIARYINALKSGAIFPPVIVARLDKKYYLIDGMHRIEAFKGRKEKYIQADILDGLDKKGIYVEAIKRNITHGKQFTTQEVTKIAMNLQNFKMTKEEISGIIRIPANSIEPFIARRMTRITETEEQVALKNPLRHLAGGYMSQEMEREEDNLSGQSQVQMFDNIILLFESGMVDKESKEVNSRIAKLKKMIDLFLGIDLSTKQIKVEGKKK